MQNQKINSFKIKTKKMHKQNSTIQISKTITVVFSKSISGTILIRSQIDANKKSPVGLNIFVGELSSGKWRSSDRKLGQRIFNHLWKYKQYEFASCVQQLQSIRAAY